MSIVKYLIPIFLDHDKHKFVSLLADGEMASAANESVNFFLLYLIPSTHDGPLLAEVLGTDKSSKEYL